ncbi:YMGG-like glycine zipper-containing protein [Pedobacter psychroterrae]|uniref:Glycine zipper 2TM domain-containing protein n=1 Tax=Pedobacter psychroterrae TaxID=2530453 RepID=A0A4R0NPM8_9SPHI|nr:YMGG-like glycine zipper-containing protein [Pedobacter psychroterrae]TCD01683.1 glycine zipper 2TM domain-containing protein [Pedobacter psychroterrae]
MKHTLLIFVSAVLLSACTNNAKEDAAIKQQAIVAVKDSLKLDSFKRAEVKKQEDQKVAARVNEEKRMLLLSERNEAASAPAPREYSEQAVPAKKKGWSAAAKGAVIGAGAGALGGVLIDKKDGRGAIIGGVVGAGTGYLIGRDKDRKSGRVQPKN